MDKMFTNEGDWQMTHRWVSCGQEDREWRGQIDVLVANGDEDTASSAAQLPVEDGVENGVVALHVLHQKGVAEPQCTLQVLTESIIQETTGTERTW